MRPKRRDIPEFTPKDEGYVYLTSFCYTVKIIRWSAADMWRKISFYSHSTISWRLYSLADKESFGGHLYRTVRRYDKNLRVVAIDEEEAPMKAKHAVIHDTFTLERRYPSAPAKVYRYFSEPEYRKRAHHQ